LILIYTGSVNMAATETPSVLEKKMGTMAWENSVAQHAPSTSNPMHNDASAISSGLDHYKENCVVCHSAPGMDYSEIGKGMNPKPTRLDSRGTQHMTDGQLFWVIKTGIRMTGMPAFGPTHEDDEIWKIVSFIRHLPNLTPEEKAVLKKTNEEEEEHHHS